MTAVIETCIILTIVLSPHNLLSPMPGTGDPAVSRAAPCSSHSGLGVNSRQMVGVNLMLGQEGSHNTGSELSHPPRRACAGSAHSRRAQVEGQTGTACSRPPHPSEPP